MLMSQVVRLCLLPDLRKVIRGETIGLEKSVSINHMMVLYDYQPGTFSFVCFQFHRTKKSRIQSLYSSIELS